MLDLGDARGDIAHVRHHGLRQPGMRNGGAGCISAIANTNPGPIARLFETRQSADADAQQKRLDEIRATFAKYPMIPALKAAVAHYGGGPGGPRCARRSSS